MSVVAFEIVRRTVRDAAEDNLLGGTPGEQHLEEIEELLLRMQVAVLLRRVERVAEGPAPGDDRHLLHRLRIADEVRHQRVAALVVGEDALLLVGDDPALLQPRDDALESGLEVRLR